MTTPLRVKKLRPGDDTDTYCGRCKAEGAHQVVALMSERISGRSPRQKFVVCPRVSGTRRRRVEGVAYLIRLNVMIEH